MYLTILIQKEWKNQRYSAEYQNMLFAQIPVPVNSCYILVVLVVVVVVIVVVVV